MSRTELVLPILGETVSEGTVSIWHVAVGESFEAGDVLLEVSTDKVEAEIEAPAAGVVEEIAAPEGTTIDVGDVLAWFMTIADSAPSPGAQASAQVLVAPEPPVAPQRPTSEVPVASISPDGPAGHHDRRPVARNAQLSPVVRRLLAEHGLSASEVVGTGRGDRVTRADVLTTAALPATARSMPLAERGAATPRPLSSPAVSLATIDTLTANVDLSRVGIANERASRTACLLFALLRSLESVAGVPATATSPIVVDGRRLDGAGDLRVTALDGAIATSPAADDDAPVSLWDLVDEPLTGAGFAPTSQGAIASFTVAPSRTEVITGGPGALEFRQMSTITASYRAGAMTRTAMRDLLVDFARRIAHTDWSTEIGFA